MKLTLAQTAEFDLIEENVIRMQSFETGRGRTVFFEPTHRNRSNVNGIIFQKYDLGVRFISHNLRTNTFCQTFTNTENQHRFSLPLWPLYYVTQSHNQRRTP